MTHPGSSSYERGLWIYFAFEPCFKLSTHIMEILHAHTVPCLTSNHEYNPTLLLKFYVSVWVIINKWPSININSTLKIVYLFPVWGRCGLNIMKRPGLFLSPTLCRTFLSVNRIEQQVKFFLGLWVNLILMIESFDQLIITLFIVSRNWCWYC